MLLCNCHETYVCACHTEVIMQTRMEIVMLQPVQTSGRLALGSSGRPEFVAVTDNGEQSADSYVEQGTKMGIGCQQQPTVNIPCTMHTSL